MNIPTIEEAENMLLEAEKLNPGLWIPHCKAAGFCAEKIAEKCSGLDSKSAHVLAMLHDIGRRAGITTLRHIVDGYNYMNEKGYKDVSKICMTHSFPIKSLKCHTGKIDCSDEEIEFIKNYIDSVEYDDYDRLVQLCDVLAFPTGPCIIEKRLVNIALRHGINDFTIEKWKKTFELKEYFDKKASCNIYELLNINVLD